MADTRRQILLTIKEQTQLLREPVDPLTPNRQQHRWSPQQWWESFTFLVSIWLPAPEHELFLLLCANHALPCPTYGTKRPGLLQGLMHMHTLCHVALQFVNHSSAGHQQHQDDLLFFVRHHVQQAGASPQVFVRRKGKQLPEDLQLTGRDFNNVDWAQTVLLNLVLHSQYQLTVVACG